MWLLLSPCACLSVFVALNSVKIDNPGNPTFPTASLDSDKSSLFVGKTNNSSMYVIIRSLTRVNEFRRFLNQFWTNFREILHTLLSSREATTLEISRRYFYLLGPIYMLNILTLNCTIFFKIKFKVVAQLLENSACKIPWQVVENWLRNQQKSFITVSVNPTIITLME